MNKVSRSSRKRMANRIGKRGYRKSGTRAQMKMIEKHNPKLWAEIQKAKRAASQPGNEAIEAKTTV